MTDLNITTNREIGVAQIEGASEAGIEFVDAVVTTDLQAVDAGRIIIPERALQGVLEQAREAGLGYHEELA